MIIKANGMDIAVKNIYSETIRQNGKSFPAFRFVFNGGVTADELDALCSGAFEMYDDNGEVIASHEGYTTRKELSFTLGKITTTEQQLSALEHEYSAAKAEHEEYKGAVRNILPVLDDETALTVKNLFPVWEIGKVYSEGERFVYDGELYKVRPGQAHTSQSDWLPDATASLYERIDENHAGTIDDPIPYNGNMALENGKYYSQDGVTYLCTRDSGNPLYNKLVELVGHYVELA